MPPLVPISVIGTGFVQWPEAQELIGDLLLSAHGYEPTQGDDHEPRGIMILMRRLRSRNA